MSSWSKRRKLTYLSIVAVLIIGVFVIPGYFIFYTAPTCFDKMKNGSEWGIDCGGACARLCPSAFETPKVAWTRFERVSPTLYNVAAYIENPNTEAEAKNVPYRVTIYDNEGSSIADYDGTVTLPPHRNTLAFRASLSPGTRQPVKAFFEFTGIPDWRKKADSLSHLVFLDRKYTEDVDGASLTVTLRNNNVQPLGHMSVYVVLYDKDDNALGFSKTTLDGIGPNATAIAPFTWPNTHGGKVISIEVLPVAE